ncbi:MAG: hypothetical protein DRR16_32320 [Candidatus Parabeggiatoa sp. nov. 3]|nr:MAG: hypothetical protein DRR00_15155 [Gammaproteobacteria bacterium]RKZ62192.1 MAG: hypothetical protein DRQ99_19195 [Gammaproteobacteria bacterium]RKZ74235.1 MAG: hypothetical protein DRR16_32320 [Gammaproteobacteria bacterium]
MPKMKMIKAIGKETQCGANEYPATINKIGKVRGQLHVPTETASARMPESTVWLACYGAAHKAT